MTSLESRVMGSICFIFAAVFGLLEVVELAVPFCILALGLLSWALYKDFSGGGGPHTLKPA
jgi:hypothetical protein